MQSVREVMGIEVTDHGRWIVPDQIQLSSFVSRSPSFSHTYNTLTYSTIVALFNLRVSSSR